MVELLIIILVIAVGAFLLYYGAWLIGIIISFIIKWFLIGVFMIGALLVVLEMLGLI